MSAEVIHVQIRLRRLICIFNKPDAGAPISVVRERMKAEVKADDGTYR